MCGTTAADRRREEPRDIARPYAAGRRAARQCGGGSAAAAAAAITVSLDSTFIRSREEGERHLEVRVGNVETAGGGRQVFGAVAKAGTDITALIRRNFKSLAKPTTPR